MDVTHLVGALTLPVFTGAGVMVLLSRATESLVSQNEQDNFQRSCDDLFFRVHDVRPIEQLPAATSQRVRRIFLAVFAIGFVAVLYSQMVANDQPANLNAPQQVFGVAAYILGGALLAVLAFGQRLADWMSASGDFNRFIGRCFVFIVGLPLLIWSASSVAVWLAVHAPHFSSLWLGWGATIACLVLGVVASGLLGLWWTVTFSVYSMWGISSALWICHAAVRVFEKIMWRISMAAKGAVAASSATVGILAGVVQLLYQVSQYVHAR